MPILITIDEDLREYMTVAVDQQGRRSPVTITNRSNLINHLAGVMRRILWGLDMTGDKISPSVSFGLPVVVHMACQITIAMPNYAMSVLQVIAEQVQIDVSRIVPVYPAPAHAREVIEEAQRIAVAATDRVHELEREMRITRGGW